MPLALASAVTLDTKGGDSTLHPLIMNVIVTGATGTVGTLVADHLADAGFEVTAVDRTYKQGRSYPIRIVDLLNREAAYGLLPGIDAIVHLANHATQRAREPQTLVNENIAMNTNLFQAAMEMGTPKIVFASSIHVMTGDRLLKDRHSTQSSLSYLPLDSASPAVPEGPYALSKYLSEEILRFHCRISPLQAIALRLPFVLADRRHMRWFGQPHDFYRLDEAFNFLPGAEVGPLVEAVLRADLPGFRTYFPTAQENLLNRPADELAREYFPDVPLKNLLEPLPSLADNSIIEVQTGWKAKPFDFDPVS